MYFITADAVLCGRLLSVYHINSKVLFWPQINFSAVLVPGFIQLADGVQCCCFLFFCFFDYLQVVHLCETVLVLQILPVG